jgi:hypothetical protein
MDEQKEIPFRYAHGLLKVDCASKSWNDIQVRYFEKYPGPGKAYADMSSERSTLVVCLEQRGGHCEARLNLNVPEVDPIVWTKFRPFLDGAAG